ncbi:hypothetical protein AAVH_23592 [Aphelenchoides avenae]|nr:hypothetical protein AAVH_23592 [Aphelenchus avenae]
MLSRIFLTAVLLPLAISPSKCSDFVYRAKRQAGCASCPLTFACTDWQDFVDGVMTWTTAVDANGCTTLTISCGEEAGVTPAISYQYLYAGTYLIDQANMPITCQADGQWLPQADSQSFTCAGLSLSL